MTSILVSVIIAFTLSTLVLFIVTRRHPRRRITTARDVSGYRYARLQYSADYIVLECSTDGQYWTTVIVEDTTEGR